MNLYIKLSLLGLTLVLFTTGTLFYFSNKAAKANLKQQILEDFGQRAILKMASIDRFIQQRKSDIQMAALNPVLRSRTRFSTEELNALLKDMEKVNKLYYSYSFFDTNRIRLADSKGLSVGEQHSNSRYWKQIDFNHPNGNFEIDFSLSESIGQIVVHCASIVYDYNNRPTGVLVSRVLVDRLYEVFIDKDIGFQKYKARLELIDKDGAYLYSSDGKKNSLEELIMNCGLIVFLEQKPSPDSKLKNDFSCLSEILDISIIKAAIGFWFIAFRSKGHFWQLK